jgi:hypothetical protein
VGPARAAAPGYKFMILAQTGDTIAGKMLTSVGDAAINDAGTVVFLHPFREAPVSSHRPNCWYQQATPSPAVR